MKPGVYTRGALACLVALAACGGESGPERSSTLLSDRTAESGLGTFVHMHGGVGDHELPETMGGGIALLDAEGDGDLDLYAAQSGPLRLPDGSESRKGSRNALYTNTGTGTFERAKGALGAGDPGYGQGVAAGDYDGDGRDDLLSLNWGPNRLYRNATTARSGQAQFVDVTTEAGIVVAGDWSVSAAFFDAEGDGDLDLYVVNYLLSPPAAHVQMGSPAGFEGYPHPDHFAGVPDRLYENVDGRFVERTEAAGVYRPSGKGLGVVPTDIELDGLVDLYVANDSVPNFLFHNRSERGELLFEEVGLRAGVAYNEDGRSEAGMGVDTADVDGDGDFDLFVTNLDAETNTLYLNDGARLRYRDSTARLGLAEPSKNLVGFGALFGDFDLDGDADLLVVNGHVLDNAHVLSDIRTYEQPTTLYLNDGARFSLAAPEVAGPGLDVPTVSRGSAFGDLDGDGDLDWVIANNAGTLQVFFGTPPEREALFLTLLGPPGNRHGLGTAVTIELADGRSLLFRVESARSYGSSSQPVVVTGLPASVVSITVLWPGAVRERWSFEDGPPERRLTLEIGTGESR